jgi:hypothetical protein
MVDYSTVSSTEAARVWLKGWIAGKRGEAPEQADQSYLDGYINGQLIYIEKQIADAIAADPAARFTPPANDNQQVAA